MKAKILIVDDEPKNLTALEKTLQSTDAELVKAGSGNEALAACLNHDFALAILDVRMPEMDGYELAEHMRGNKKTQHVPIVFVTGTTGDARAEFRGYEAGAVDFVTKPVDPRILLSKVKVFLKLHQQNIELRESEQRFRDMALSSADWVWEVDGQGRYTYCSERVAEVLGYSAEELLGQTLFDLMPADEATRIGTIFEKIARGREPIVELENWNISREGRDVCLLTNGVPMFDADGDFRGYRGVHKDITERKQTMAALENSRRELLFRNQIANIFLSVPDDEMYAAVLEILLDAVDSKYGVFGYLDEDDAFIVPTMTRTVWDKCQVPEKTFTFPRERWGNSSWPRAIREKRTICLNEPSLLTPEGHIPITRHVSMPIIHQGKVVGLVQIANKDTDYTERDIELLETLGHAIAPVLEARLKQERHERQREQAENRVREGEQKYYSLIDNIAGMVYRGKPDWSVEFVIGAENLCGYASDSLAPGRDVKWIDLIHPEDKDRVLGEAAQLSEEPKNLVQKYRVICKDGSVLWVEDHKSSRLAGDGAFLGVDGIVFDVTARQEMEEQLIAARSAADAANRAKSAFVANMSHEIRTPLNAVVGLTHLVLKTELSPRQRDYLSKIRGASHALLAIVNDILDFSKIEAGKLRLESVEFELASVTRQLFDVFGLQAQQKGLQLFFSVGSDVPSPLVGDPARLRQILTNLLSNAVKFTESGQITISARALNDEPDREVLEFAVRDTGVGMTQEQLARVFDAFNQAEAWTSRRFGGTGLGLSICKRLIDMMGGDIRVQSQPAQGSTFTFTAVFGQPDRKSAGRLEVGPELRGLPVLVVEDDEAMRDSLARRLGIHGLSPSVASSAEEAITVLHQAPAETPYELLLVDWDLPGLDGLQMCDGIRKDGSSQPTPRMILISGYWNHELATCVDERRVDAFLLKPFTPSTLFETILQVFADRFTARPAPLEHEATGPGVPDLRGACILLAEDNELNQEVALGMLAETGCEVSLARNGTEAVEAVAEKTFDLILMDIQMPEMDGYEATRRIREVESASLAPGGRSEGAGAPSVAADAAALVSPDSAAKDAPKEPMRQPQAATDRKPPSRLSIIAMTAGAMEEDRGKALAAGMDDHIAKPVDPDELYRVLAKWTGSGTRHDREPDKSGQAATHASKWEDELRERDVIDVDAALARFRGDAKRLRAFLRKFTENQASAAEDIRAALDAGDTAGAERLVHTLKGFAGTIGAERLQRASREVETPLKDGVGDAARSLVPALEQRLQEVFDSLSRLAPEPAPSPAADEEAGRPASPEELAPLLSRLAVLLENHDPAALECVQDLAAKPMPRAVSTVVRQLSKLVGRYAFKEALARLKDLANSLDIDLTGSNADAN